MSYQQVGDSTDHESLERGKRRVVENRTEMVRLSDAN
jgi:hypothetical protein